MDESAHTHPLVELQAGDLRCQHLCCMLGILLQPLPGLLLGDLLLESHHRLAGLPDLGFRLSMNGQVSFQNWLGLVMEVEAARVWSLFSHVIILGFRLPFS